MNFKEPQFWYDPSKRIGAVLLLPFSLVFMMLGWIRHLFLPTKRAPCPIICIGNITVGGTGKTPTALKIGSLLKARGKKVHFLTKGYGGNLEGPVQVNPQAHTYEDVGDEALLLAEVAPTWVSKNRYKGARAAYKRGAEIIIMDDGFQNPSLFKDLSLVVVDGSRGFGNGFVLPAGPLREPLFEGLERADALVVVGKGDVISNKPVLKAQLKASELSLTFFKAGKYLAFCGIGNPEKFFTTLRDNKINLIKTIVFPDHHAYSKTEVLDLLKKAQQSNAKLLTTHKDWVRLPSVFQSDIDILEVDLVFENETDLVSLFEKANVK